MKSGFAALIGRPNVGKSTLMNHLIGQKIAITSEKAQTTRSQIRTVYTDERGQIVFEDTPGLTRAKNKLGRFMVDVAEKTIADADVILWIVEAGAYLGASEQEILERLRKVNKPLVLVVNKVDKVQDKKALAQSIEAYEKAVRPSDLIAVSALKHQNMEILLETLFRYLPEGPLFYDEDTVTEEPMRDIAAELIREQALRLLRDEVPHGIAVTVERMHEREDGTFDIDAEIICERESHKGMVIGKGGQMLKRIGTGARKTIEEMCGAPVNLKLWVKVRKEWRDNDTQLKSFGYDLKKLK
ncbi:MAG: GTPase Era [Stomatobaculum sp.]|jgi:GTP-binding protein Era|nr:GTPase Era [Stomatobaculum sp.]